MKSADPIALLVLLAGLLMASLAFRRLTRCLRAWRAQRREYAGHRAERRALIEKAWALRPDHVRREFDLIRSLVAPPTDEELAAAKPVKLSPAAGPAGSRKDRACTPIPSTAGEAPLSPGRRPLPMSATTDRPQIPRMSQITEWEAEILAHTSRNGRFVTGEQRVIDLAGRGLLFDHGPQRLTAGAHYLVTTMKGRAALSAWRSAQPKPKPAKRRRRSKSFQAWRDYLEANGRMGFREFLARIWPECRQWRQYGGFIDP